MVGSGYVNIRVPFNWLLVIILLACGLIAGYIYVPSGQRHFFVFSASVLAGAAAVIAAINAIDVRGAQLRQSKAMMALDFANRWTSPDFFHAKKSGRETMEYLRGHTDPNEQRRYVEEDPIRLANLFDILNFFETLSVAVQREIEMSRRWFRSVSGSYWHIAEEFVKRRRAERANPRLFIEAEWLVRKWS